MINRIMHLFWSHARGVFLGILFIAVAMQAALYLGKERLQSHATSASYEELYCVAPYALDIRYLGHGKVVVSLPNREPVDVQGLVKPWQVVNGESEALLTLELEPGYNAVRLHFGSQVRSLNLMYTPAETYLGSTESIGGEGVLGFYPGDLCVGRQILPIGGWLPPPQAPKMNASVKSIVSWEGVFKEQIAFLESRRGTPNASMSGISHSNLIEAVEQNRSKVWCVQISGYLLEKLHGAIPVRMLGLTGTVGGDVRFRTGAHAFLEVLDPQFGKWAVADPTNYLLSVRWPDGSPLNAVELRSVLSLSSATMVEQLDFFMVDRVSNAVSKKKFKELDPAVARDLKFYFSRKNVLLYQSGHSSIYHNTLANKVDNWSRLDRRLILNENVTFPFLAFIRVASFWLMLVLAPVIVLVEFVRLFRRRRKIANVKNDY